MIRISSLYTIAFVFYLFSRIEVSLILGSKIQVFLVSLIIMIGSIFFVSPKYMGLKQFFVLGIFFACSLAVFVVFFDKPIMDSAGVSQQNLVLDAFGNMVLFFLTGYGFSRFKALERLRENRNIFLISYLVMIASFFRYYDSGSISYYEISKNLNGGWVNHLFYGSSFFLYTIAVAAVFQGVSRWVILVLGVTFSYVLKGDHVFVVLFCTSLIYFVVFLHRYSFVIAIFLSPFFLAITLYLALPFVLLDASVIERLEQYRYGLLLLREQLLIGDATLILEYGKGYGSYIHNLLSMIQLFGILPLVFLALLFVYFMQLIFQIAIKQDSTSSGFFAFFLFSNLVVSLLITKFIGEWMIWFGIGYLYFQSSVYKRLKGGSSENHG